MNYLFASLFAILCQFMVEIIAKRHYSYRSDNAPSLCDDPVIYAADRLVNNSVRLYRGDYYWELKGIPGIKGFLEGPYKIPYKDFGPIERDSTITTVLNGNRKGAVMKFVGKKWFAWNVNGDRQWGDHGTGSDLIPKGGFMATFHNGNTTDPMIIGLNSINVYYINTVAALYPWLYGTGKREGYMGGQFGENFPPDITSAFSYPSTDPSDGYLVYLFKKDKYCFRAAYRKDSTKPCDEWRLNRELFGCDDSSQPPQPPNPDVNNPKEPKPEPAEAKKPKSDGFAVTYSMVLSIIFIFVHLIDICV